MIKRRRTEGFFCIIIYWIGGIFYINKSIIWLHTLKSRVVFVFFYMSEKKERLLQLKKWFQEIHCMFKDLYSLHSYNLLILRMSMSDMSSLCPIGTDGSGMGVMVSSPYDDEKAVLDFKKNNKWNEINSKLSNHKSTETCQCSAQKLFNCRSWVEKNEEWMWWWWRRNGPPRSSSDWVTMILS